MAEIELSHEQLSALAAVEDWFFSSPDKTKTLGGYAGTGKSTLTRELLRRIPKPVAVCAYTGKAAHVLKTKGIDDATTIHALIYAPADACGVCGQWFSVCSSNNAVAAQLGGPQCSQASTVTRFARVDSLRHKLIVVDEASMVSTRIQQDLEAFDAKVLYIGDHGQLEPIGAGGALMADPAIRLETIHRQAEGSTILTVAHFLRRGQHPSTMGRMLVDGSVRLHDGVPHDIAEYDVVLCGFNRTRAGVNRKVRKVRGYDPAGPQPGDRVVCLRNDHEKGIFNGMLATVAGIDATEIAVVADDGRELGPMEYYAGQFGALKTLRDVDRGTTLWDYGYALTVHKAQGSEWDNVCVLEQVMPLWDASRWRYTAVTRASKRLTYCLPEGHDR